MTPCDATTIEINNDTFAEFPAGCDPDFDTDFDTDFGEIERQFANLCLTLEHN